MCSIAWLRRRGCQCFSRWRRFDSTHQGRTRTTARAPSLSLELELEEKVAQAPKEIRREAERGILRFGERFERGDQAAVILMQQNTIELQNSLLEALRHADFDNERDVQMLIDVADLKRSRTIGALNEL